MRNALIKCSEHLVKCLKRNYYFDELLNAMIFL